MLCVCARAECRWRMCLLEHPSPANFYVSCWQSNRSAAPLLLLRSFLFLFSTCVVLASIAVPLTLNSLHFGHWFIYLTHWGFLLIVLTTGFGTAVSAYAFYKKPIGTLVFLLTYVYKTPANTVNFAPNPVLDIMLHGVNSVVMLVELVCSAHPSRLMHVMQPLYFAGAYMLFSVIYFLAGGLDPWGNPFIYPVVDWSKPEQTMVVITLTALFLALMHVLTVGIATGRDAIAKRRLALTTGVYNDAFTP
ncbi:hypothetical protein HF086_003863 [Spodoptera exigua]|uniref:Protein rolling stone-like n=1 Tax=Spodoptera exigua TaxID=7107 RepID=A0A922MT14_SPOEX|nr:hypothetical protein HF086_003863 [Spodoptera exigua]